MFLRLPVIFKKASSLTKGGFAKTKIVDLLLYLPLSNTLHHWDWTWSLHRLIRALDISKPFGIFYSADSFKLGPKRWLFWLNNLSSWLRVPSKCMSKSHMMDTWHVSTSLLLSDLVRISKLTNYINRYFMLG